MTRFMNPVFRVVMFYILFAIGSFASAAPYGATVLDARTGQIVYQKNGSQKLHPASLTKMMTLYIVFAEIEAGRLRLDQQVPISSNAASQPPSKMGLRAGRTIAVRDLVRAAAVKSANDAAVALAEAVAGSVPRFAEYMNMTARAMGMKDTKFLNPHGLTQMGHYSTPNDMAILGRRMVYDHPKYYNLFSRKSVSTSYGTFSNTNRAFLSNYQGADGIKTGYTRAAGYNLVASAENSGKRIIVSMFGGTSVSQRNGHVSTLLNYGFSKVPANSRFRGMARIRLNGIKRSAPAPTRVAATPKPTPQKTVAPKPTPTKTAVAPKPKVSTRKVSSLVAALPANMSAPAFRPSLVQSVARVNAANNARSTARAESNVKTPSTASNSEIDALVANVAATGNLASISSPPSRNRSGLRTNVESPRIFANATNDTSADKIEAPASRETPSGSGENQGKYAIHLDALPSKEDAERAVIDASVKNPNDLDGIKNQILKTTKNGETRYRPRFSGMSADAAKATCNTLQQAGEKCFIIAPEA